MSKFSKKNKLLFLLGISPISTVSLISCVNSIKEFSYDNIEIVFESEYKLSFLLKNFPNFPDDKLNVNQFVLNENKTPVRIRKNELGIILEYENLFPATEYKFTKFSLSNFRLNLNSAKNSFLTKGIRFLNFKINEVNSDNAKLTFNFAVNSEFTNNTFSVDFGRVSYHRYGNGSEDLEIDETTREYFIWTFDFNKESNEVILNNLLPDTLYTIHNIRYSNIVEGINQNENSRFLTPKAQEIKKIDFLNITPNNATVVLEVDKINENESYTLEISKNQEAPFKQNYFRIQNNKIYFDISNLTPDTIYYLKNIYYNHIPFNLNKISKTINFRTLKQPNNQIEEPKNPPIKNPDSNISSNETPVQPAEIRILNQDIFSNISSNSVDLNLEFNQNVSNKIIINYSESNNLHQINSGYTISNNRLFYSLNNLKPNTNYTINSISINNQNIDINHLNKSFTTLNQITNNETINYDLMDSFSNYESLVAKFKPQTQLNITNIKKIDIGIKKGLLFEFNNLSNDKYKYFSFNYNNKIYKTKYDGNSQYLIVQVDDNESNDISNINYNNQIVNFNSSIESLAKTSSNNSVIVNSIFQ
ncbi:fibronectin type III domain-containing protein [Mycoplasmopsis felis]|uniref:fibronectin type III domain-containing protein n=1 Tax=Mycoplasmopsis felis TaxID=33923 RepID=UPI0021B0487A|nr:fibronectin type III domain-containing protein [Mycoplasmopsis felis]UWV85345.1 fibronectin type III domain-containing protein [Mycoplasmopsis felis]